MQLSRPLFAGVIVVLAVLSASQSCPAEDAVTDSWRYRLQPPAAAWQQPEFDDSDWKEAPGGFGTPETPGARVGTVWTTPDIWLRKAFSLDAIPDQPALLIHHDEDAEVFLNGRQVARMEGWVTAYKVVPLDEAASNALTVGENLLAVHCRQRTGGQFIDVHLIDAENVPELPKPEREKTPFQSELITSWGEKVTPENAWTEYPRPQMKRENWQNLNGRWDYAITPRDQQTAPRDWTGKILVPYPLESRLSGVQRLLDPDEALWYRRTFAASAAEDQRTLLNFEAVDYRCDIYLNGQQVGSHQGGNTPFSIDATAAFQQGENELVVRVEDATEQWQLRGKQVLNPHGIWYTQVSGIWQTVWLEQVPASYLEDLKIATDPAEGSITVRPTIAGERTGGRLEVTVTDGQQNIATAKGTAGEIVLTIDNAKLWSPDSPHLYGLEISLLSADGKRLDNVQSYAGIRSVGKRRDDSGHLRMTLNGETIFHWGPLDQGWWPDGLLSPPSDEAMLFDIEYLKAAGFNMIRKHIKVEPRRYYYHCDRLGMMVWQDQVSGGKQPKWTRLQPDPSDALWPDEEHEQFLQEFDRMIDSLENHPSIVVWTPFNEAWGQHRTMEVGKWVAQRDPSRLINIASGGNFWPTGDIVDAHNYPHPAFPFDPERFEDFVKVIGEFGGHGYPVVGHLWDADRRNWGYGGLPKTKDEYEERYVRSLEMLNDLRAQGIAAGVYTQTTDVEGEINGLITYDRKVIKIPAKKLARLHKQLFEPAPVERREVSEASPGSTR